MHYAESFLISTFLRVICFWYLSTGELDPSTLRFERDLASKLNLSSMLHMLHLNEFPSKAAYLVITLPAVPVGKLVTVGA